MVMPGRSYSSPAYRYGYNGQEKDDEVNGLGNSLTAEYWQYDPRLGRRWNIDPEFRKYPAFSTYGVMFDNPILWNDPKGDNPAIWAAAIWFCEYVLPRVMVSAAGTFIVGASISTGVQFGANYMAYGDAQKAWGNIDWVDVAADGAINTVSGGLGSFRTILRAKGAISIMRGTTIIALEVVSASTDYTFEGSKFETIFNGDKNAFQFGASLIISMSATYTNDEISAILTKWAKEGVDASILKSLSKEDQAMYRNLAKILSTTNEITDKGIGVVKEYVEAITTADVKVNILKKNETNITSAPIDNTNYVYPAQTYEKVKQPIK